MVFSTMKQRLFMFSTLTTGLILTGLLALRAQEPVDVQSQRAEGASTTQHADCTMFGPQRERPCPMCTNLLGAWEGNAADIGQRISLVVVARSPIERLIAWKRERGWRNLRHYSDLNDAFSRDYFGLLPDGSEIPAFNVFTRRDGTIRHFWSGEMTGSTADPGQDPRGAPDPAPLWMVLDSTPEGRGGDWYPKLDYGV